MKKLFAFLIAFGFAVPAWASHFFTVCYYNQTNSAISYNNDGISHKWKNRGELVGSGSIPMGQSKCFGKIMDETLFTKDYITFYVDGKWMGIVNSGFANPYVIAQDAQAKKGGLLIDDTRDGRDNYQLNVFVTDSGIVYSNGEDITNKEHFITPRSFN
ncbi:MAG: hypothetical protein ACK4M7_02545 [Burkholderiales bacterium]